MGTTKVKVIDLSSNEPVVKASRKAARLAKPSVDLETKRAQKVRPSINTEDEKAQTPETKSKKLRPSIETEEKPAAQKPKASAISKVAKRVRGSKYQNASKLIDKTKTYGVKDALELLGKTSYIKFDPTVEIHINVTQKNIRGSINFPHPVGPKKEKKYLVFSEKLKSTDSKNVILSNDSTIDDILSGRLKPSRDFNAVLASAKFMPQLARVAKILGPAGMMPNPKNGTITEEPEKVFGAEGSEAYEFRGDPQAPIVHLKLGKLSNKSQALEENLKAALTAIGPGKIKKATLSSTMSPGIRLDISSL